MAGRPLILLRKLHFSAVALCYGFAFSMAVLSLPDIAVAFFSDVPNACASPDSHACKAAQSSASLVLGISSGVKALVSLVLSPMLGTISDVYGRRFYVIGGQAAGTLSYVALLWHVLGHTSLWPFLALNTLTGLLLPALLAVVADEYSPAKRAQAFGLFIATFDVSLLLGPVLGAQLNLRATAGCITAASVAGLLLFAAYGETMPREQRLQSVRGDGPPPWRPDKALGLLNSAPLFRRLSYIIVASTMPQAGAQQCFVLFLEASFKVPRSAAAGHIAVLAVSGLAVQVFLLPCLMRNLRITRVLLLGLGLQFLQFAIFACAHSLFAVTVGCLIGGFGSIVFPCVSALKANSAKPEEQGRVQGAISALQSSALGIGPTIYGAVFALLIGPHSPFGRQLPQAVWGVSLLLLAPACMVTATLDRHVPASVLYAQPPPVRRHVSDRDGRGGLPLADQDSCSVARVARDRCTDPSAAS